MHDADPAMTHPFAGFDLAHLVDLQARVQGERPFLVWSPFVGNGRVWSYAAFADDVARVAAAMARRGVRQGGRVLIHLDNCPEMIIAWFACAHIGATAVATNTRAAGPELAYFATHSKVVAAITQPKFAAKVAEFCQDLTWMSVTDTDNGEPPGFGTAPARDMSFSTLLANAERAPPRKPDPCLPLGIQYTSGTTSRPKGVVLTHANGLWGAKIGAAHAGLRAEDIFLIHLPLYHVIALSYGVLATLWAGGSVVLLPRFSASRFWAHSLRHRCTWAAMVPFCVRALAVQEAPTGHFYRAWGNAFWSPELERRYKLGILGWWGMTEIVTHGIVSDLSKPGRPQAIGRPALEYQVAIEHDDGTPVAPGETGNLLIRGRRGISLFAEYLDDPVATTASFDDRGFFKTGDLVTFHADGFIQFSDRAKDMLKVGGENVAASEVERVIQGVAGVREAAVVGRPDTMLQEVPVAFVIPGTDARPEQLRQRIIDACRQSLADFKVPRDVLIVDDLPRGSMEKVSKVELRRRVDASVER
jgi:crotonobetaine/carnitine-CoA ligase